MILKRTINPNFLPLLVANISIPVIIDKNKMRMAINNNPPDRTINAKIKSKTVKPRSK